MRWKARSTSTLERDGGWTTDGEWEGGLTVSAEGMRRRGREAYSIDVEVLKLQAVRRQEGSRHGDGCCAGVTAVSGEERTQHAQRRSGERASSEGAAQRQGN